MGSYFNGYANFVASKFNCYAYFGVSKFNGNAYFGDSVFNGDVYFTTKFNKAVYFVTNFKFNVSTFNGVSYFGGSKFNGVADFSSSKFNSYAYFMNSQFNNTTKFGEASFQKETKFRDSVFIGNTSFNNVQFKEDARFEGTNFNCTIDLTETKYVNLYIRWRDIKNLAYDETAYLLLMENFKKLGYLEDYDNCYFEYRKGHRSQSWSGSYHGMSPIEEGIRKVGDSGLEISYGYGTRPLNAICLSIAIIFAFGIFWWVIDLLGPDDITGEEIKVCGKPDGILDAFCFSIQIFIKEGFTLDRILGAFSFSIAVFLSGTRLFIDPPDVPKKKGKSRSIVKKVFTFERILGALFSILFFLAIGGTVMRYGIVTTHKHDRSYDQ
ncbi:Pentapeptide repeats (9 copies) [uncultured archaeon]|nr:Pentapeptide repeats (9 copies) [uncultured archaeon]